MNQPELMRNLTEADIATMDDNTFSEYYGKSVNFQENLGSEDIEFKEPPKDISDNFINLPEDEPEEVPNETPAEIPTSPQDPSELPVGSEETPYYSAIEDPGSWYDTVTQPIRIDGIDLDMSDPEVVRKLIEKGAKSNLNQPNDIKFKRIVRSLDKNGIDTDTLNMIIAAYNGDKRAISKIISRNAIIPAELDYIDYDSDYATSSEDYLVSENDIRLDEVVHSLSSPDSKGKIDDFLQTLDHTSQEYVENHPDTYLALDKFMSSGLHDRILKAIDQSKLQNGFDDSVADLERYRMIAAALVQQDQEQAELNSNEYSDTQYQDSHPSRKSASLPRNRAFNQTEEKPKQFTPEEIASMPDEDFLKYFK